MAQNQELAEFGRVVTMDTTSNSITLVGNLNVTNTSVTGKIQMGTPSAFDFGANAVIEIDSNTNTYNQIVIQNANTGNNASSDLVVTTDTGNDSNEYIDLGINNSGYNQAAFNIVGVKDGYLYTSNGALAIGTASAKPLIFHSNGTTTTFERMRIDAGGNVGISNTTPDAKLAVTGTANVSGVLTVGGIANFSANTNLLASANVSGNLNVTGFANVTANLTVTGFANVTANLTVTGSANVGTNSFFVGSFTNAAAGFTILPNRIKMNWGIVVPNSVGSNTVTLSSAFVTNTYGLSLTIFGTNSAGLGNSGFVRANTVNSSTINIITTSNGTLSNTNIASVYYLAIGPA